MSILYSGEFRAIIPYISFAIVGTVMRAYSWFLAIVIVARGDGKIYIVTETLSVLTGLRSTWRAITCGDLPDSVWHSACGMRHIV